MQEREQREFREGKKSQLTCKKKEERRDEWDLGFFLENMRKTIEEREEEDFLGEESLKIDGDVLGKEKKRVLEEFWLIF